MCWKIDIFFSINMNAHTVKPIHATPCIQRTPLQCQLQSGEETHASQRSLGVNGTGTHWCTPSFSFFTTNKCCSKCSTSAVPPHGLILLVWRHYRCISTSNTKQASNVLWTRNSSRATHATRALRNTQHAKRTAQLALNYSFFPSHFTHLTLALTFDLPSLPPNLTHLTFHLTLESIVLLLFPTLLLHSISHSVLEGHQKSPKIPQISE